MWGYIYIYLSLQATSAVKHFAQQKILFSKASLISHHLLWFFKARAWKINLLWWRLGKFSSGMLEWFHFLAETLTFNFFHKKSRHLLAGQFWLGNLWHEELLFLCMLFDDDSVEHICRFPSTLALFLSLLLIQSCWPVSCKCCLDACDTVLGWLLTIKTRKLIIKWLLTV